MSKPLQEEFGFVLFQAIFHFDGSPEQVVELRELSTVLRFFAVTHQPHPDTRRVLSRYASLEEVEWTEEKEEISQQKKAMLEMMLHADITADEPPVGAVLLIQWWCLLKEGLPIPQQAALVCDPNTPLAERMKMLSLLA